MSSVVDLQAISGSDQALMYALSNVARSGATRSGYVSGFPVISIGGVVTGAGKSRRVLLSSLTIQDLLNETPNTCTFTVQGEAPTEGSDILITFGSVNNLSRLFAGTVLRYTQVYVVQNPQHVLWQVEGIDWTWRLNSKLVTARYQSKTADVIVQDLVARYGPAGFQTRFPEPLPRLDEISFTNTPLMDAITQVATRIGGYATCDYHKVVIVWLGQSPAGTLPPLTPAHPTLQDVSYIRDLSQIVTRAIVEGGGANALTDVPAGETRIPIEDLTWYLSSGGRATSGPQQLTYGGLQEGGGGALVGTGAVMGGTEVTPSNAPLVALATGAGLPDGTYQYAYTWVTAAGETKPSPTRAVTPGGGVADPTTPASPQASSGTGALVPGYGYAFKYAYALSTSTSPPTSGLTLPSPSPSGWSICGAERAFDVTVPYSPDPRIKRVWIYRLRNDPAWTVYHADTSAANSQSSGSVMIRCGLSDNTVLAQAAAPTANTTGEEQRQAVVTGIAIGPPGVTARKVYRTAANGAQLKLLTTLANNTATALPANDIAADGTLGANAPTSDTSGLTTGATGGQVPAGATTMRVSSTAPFGAEGWAEVGGQIIRYRGVTSTDLTGIPATGPGSLGVTVAYSEPIVVAPQLVGIPASGAGAIVLPINQGDAVNLLVIEDDLRGQNDLKVLIGGDGIIESAQQDNRISFAEAQSRARALLAQRWHQQETVRYRSRDPRTKSGARVDVDLRPLFHEGTGYLIQDVAISGFLGTAIYPIFEAVASTNRFTFEDLLRQERQRRFQAW